MSYPIATRRLSSLLALATVALAHSSVAPAQDARDSGVAEAPRPKVEQDAQYDLGRGGYDVRVFFQEGRSFEDLSAHVYYEPLIYLMTDEDSGGGLRYKLREYDSHWQLTLKFRGETDRSYIDQRLRDALMSEARRRDPELQSVANSDFAYRISPITIHRALFVSTRPRGVERAVYESHLLARDGKPMTIVSDGEYNIYFDFDTREDAETFVADLENGGDTLRFEYQFRGVADETCEATFAGQELQSATRNVKAGGPAGEGYVTRNRVADLTERVIRSEAITARCPYADWSGYLYDQLIARLGKHTSLSLEDGWTAIDKLNVFDPNDFRANFKTRAESVEKTLVRDMVVNALSKAESESESGESGGGLAASIGPVTLGGSGHESESEAQATSEARKYVKDDLEQQGILGEWEGGKFVPKTLNVHTKETLERGWGTDITITQSFPSSAVAPHIVDLHLPQSRYDVVGPNAIGQLEEKIQGALDAFEDRTQGRIDAADRRSQQASERAANSERSARDASARAKASAESAKAAASAAKRAEGVAKRAEEDITEVKKCTYSLRRPSARDLRTGAQFYHHTGKKADIAVVSGFYHRAYHCENVGIRMIRHKDQWTILAHDWPAYDKCDALDVDITYISGAEVSDRAWNVIRGSLPCTRATKSRCFRLNVRRSTPCD